MTNRSIFDDYYNIYSDLFGRRFGVAGEPFNVKTKDPFQDARKGEDNSMHNGGINAIKRGNDKENTQKSGCEKVNGLFGELTSLKSNGNGRVKVKDKTYSPYMWSDECSRDSEYTYERDGNSVKVYDSSQKMSVSFIIGDKKLNGIIYTNGFIVISYDLCSLTIYSIAKDKIKTLKGIDSNYIGRGFFAYSDLCGYTYLTTVDNNDGGLGIYGVMAKDIYPTHLGVSYENMSDHPWIVVTCKRFDDAEKRVVYAICVTKSKSIDYVEIHEDSFDCGKNVCVGYEPTKQEEEVPVKQNVGDVNDDKVGKAIGDIITAMGDKGEKFIKKLEADDDYDRVKTRRKRNLSDCKNEQTVTKDTIYPKGAESTLNTPIHLETVSHEKGLLDDLKVACDKPRSETINIEPLYRKNGLKIDDMKRNTKVTPKDIEISEEDKEALKKIWNGVFSDIMNIFGK